MKRQLLALGLVVGCMVGTAVTTHNVEAAGKKKVWTITDRQQELRKRVEKGQKANELTAKEAGKMNDMLDDIAKDIDKMKEKNDGKLSYKDEGKIEKRLNK